MKRLLSLLMCLLLTLCVLSAAAEDGAPVFDLAALENDETLMSYVDDNGVDMIYRHMDQPWIGTCDEGEASVFLDYAELANEDAVALRLTVAVMLDDMLAADTLTLSVGGRAWRFSVHTIPSEYDMVYQEDYSVCLAGDGLALLRAMAESGAQPLRFELSGYRTISGIVTVPGEAVRAILARWQSLGGERQDLTKVETRWPVSAN